MPSNTPLPAAEFRRLEDEVIVRYDAWSDLLRNGVRDGKTEVAPQWEAYQQAVHNLRAARAASPVTLEEVLMIRSCRAYNDYIFARDLPGNGDPDELLAKYNAAHRAQAEYACTLSVAAYESEEHTRRLAGEGGGQ